MTSNIDLSTNQPTGWFGNTVMLDAPYLTNLRLDPFERTGFATGGGAGSQMYMNWWMYEFWRFQFVQKTVATVAQSAIEYPPMQKGATFSLESVKAQIQKAIAARAGQ